MNLSKHAHYPLVFFFLLGVPASSAGQTAEPSSEQCLGGRLDAAVRIEVFSDFQCPACRSLYLDVMQKVMQDYSNMGKVCVIYHEFPLPAHSLAREAARYSKAAQRLGPSQWRAVITALYEFQGVWTWDGSIDAVVFKALDKEDFFKLKKLLEDPSIDTAINSDVALGGKRQVQSTPTFFLRAAGKEERVVGGIPYRVLKDFIDRALR